MDEETRILLVPGGGGSGIGHWDHQWERDDPRVDRVVQPSWDSGTRQQWLECIDSHVVASDRPTFLVAHSLGCIAVAHWMARHRAVVKGAMLVAPADVEDRWALEGNLYRQFSPIPRAQFPVPSIIVASSDDPYLSLTRARLFASKWGASLEEIGDAGHIGSESGLSDWPQGKLILERMIDATR